MYFIVVEIINTSVEMLKCVCMIYDARLLGSSAMYLHLFLNVFLFRSLCFSSGVSKLFEFLITSKNQMPFDNDDDAK